MRQVSNVLSKPGSMLYSAHVLIIYPYAVELVLSKGKVNPHSPPGQTIWRSWLIPAYSTLHGMPYCTSIYQASLEPIEQGSYNLFQELDVSVSS